MLYGHIYCLRTVHALLKTMMVTMERMRDKDINNFVVGAITRWITDVVVIDMVDIHAYMDIVVLWMIVHVLGHKTLITNKGLAHVFLQSCVGPVLVIGLLVGQDQKRIYTS